MTKELKLMIAYFFTVVFLVSCGGVDQKNKSIIDASEESFVEESNSLEYNCDNLQVRFSSYDEAKEAIEKTDFRIEETVNTSKSSWVNGASYFSCDGKVGYFLLITDSEDYLHSDVPFNVWQGFKNAESFGSYYNRFIKNKYAFKLN